MTALFAPAPARETLFTLYAFNHELARARDVASQPMMALIRLAWWREVVNGASRPHEVATPLGAAIANAALDAANLGEMIDARMMEAEDGIDTTQFAAYVRGAGGALMRQAGLVLGAGDEAEALTRLGSGCSAAGLLRNAAARAAQGGWSLPHGRDRQWAAEEAARLLGAPRRWTHAAMPAALPAVFARRYLLQAPNARRHGVANLAIWAAARRDTA